jgi:dATP pyrophosphohydrolase
VKKPVSVLVLIHTSEAAVLLLERAAHPGFWQSVTGSQEGDEPLPLTAAREVAEETGIRIRPEDLDDWHLANRYELFPEWRYRYAPGVTENVEHVFSLLCPAQTPITVAPGEHLGYVWLPWREAANTVFSWSNRDAILMLSRKLKLK